METGKIPDGLMGEVEENLGSVEGATGPGASEIRRRSLRQGRFIQAFGEIVPKAGSAAATRRA